MANLSGLLQPQSPPPSFASGFAGGFGNGINEYLKYLFQSQRDEAVTQRQRELETMRSTHAADAASAAAMNKMLYEQYFKQMEDQRVQDRATKDRGAVWQGLNLATNPQPFTAQQDITAHPDRGDRGGFSPGEQTMQPFSTSWGGGGGLSAVGSEPVSGPPVPNQADLSGQRVGTADIASQRMLSPQDVVGRIAGDPSLAGRIDLTKPDMQRMFDPSMIAAARADLTSKKMTVANGIGSEIGSGRMTPQSGAAVWGRLFPGEPFPNYQATPETQLKGMEATATAGATLEQQSQKFGLTKPTKLDLTETVKTDLRAMGVDPATATPQEIDTAIKRAQDRLLANSRQRGVDAAGIEQRPPAAQLKVIEDLSLAQAKVNQMLTLLPTIDMTRISGGLAPWINTAMETGRIGPFPIDIGNLSEAEQTFLAASRDYADIVLRLRSGAQINEQEMKRMLGFLITEATKPGVVATRLRMQSADLTARRQAINDSLKSGGYRQFQAEPPTLTLPPAPAPAPAAPTASPGLRESAKRILQTNGKPTDDATVDLFLKNNPGFGR